MNLQRKDQRAVTKYTRSSEMSEDEFLWSSSKSAQGQSLKINESSCSFFVLSLLSSHHLLLNAVEQK